MTESIQSRSAREVEIGINHDAFARNPVRELAGKVLAVIRRQPAKRKQILAAARAANETREFALAAKLYEQALGYRQDDAKIHIQCGHMYKEAGDFEDAERHYQNAKQLTPNDPDLALQLGHFYKTVARLREAEIEYRRAAAMDRNWHEPAIWLNELYRSGWRDRSIETTPEEPAHDNDVIGKCDKSNGNDAEYRARLHLDAGLIPELAPGLPEDRFHPHSEEVTLRSLGRIERTRWGMANTLRGVSAVRGFCISSVPLTQVRATLNGLRLCILPLKSYPLKYERDNPQKKKYVFNIWYDFSNFVEGRHTLELQFLDQRSGIRCHQQQVVIAPPVPESQHPDSDQLVSVSHTDPGSIEAEINSRPSMVRPARRARFPRPPRNILLIRVDQLGDMVVSIPAIQRLRQFFPEARFVGLLSFGNADFARTLGLFEEIIPIDYPDDEWERRRIMPLDQQAELRRQLRPFKFDLAIDLAEAPVSRPLLLLSGAPFLYGFKDDHSPWLSAFYEGWFTDPVDRHQAVPITIKTLGMVEWLGALLGNPSQVIRRADLGWGHLASYGLSEGDRFAVFHSGARLKFSQWPHYEKLAALVLERTDLKVVMITDDPHGRLKLAPGLAQHHRFQLLEKRLPFDDLDALLSFCSVFVGNDSGPTHLASLRGTDVIDVFLARHNWNEWGHENNGYIISRRVPCAGCHIYYDPEECGREFACLSNITPEEVFAVLDGIISRQRPENGPVTARPIILDGESRRADAAATAGGDYG